MAYISFKDVTFAYPGEKRNAIDNLNIEIEKGEHIALVGRNGSGKSTFARLLNGLNVPARGVVTVDGMTTSDKTRLFDIRKTVGVVFQNPDNQTVASIVEDDVAFGPENLGVPRKEIGERIEYALNAVGMAEYRKATPSRLSGGQKQRIAIAGVLAIKPSVIVMDESTAMLDPKGRKEVTDTVKKLHDENGMTVINITHYMEEAVSADKIFVMDGGKIVASGTPEEIFADREKLLALGLDVPLTVKIADALGKQGLKIKGDVLTTEGLAEGICESLRNN